MKMVFRSLLLVCLALSTLSAQEEPIPPKRSQMAKVGLFGGFTPGWLNLDVQPVNDFITHAGGAALGSGGVFMYGGGGAIYIIVLPNVRLGGLGMSGSLKSTSLNQGIRRDAQLNAGFGGLTIEYVVPFTERLDLAMGGMLGWGGIDLTMRASNGGQNTWTDEQSTLGSSGLPSFTNNVTRVYSGKFFVVVPSVNLEYSFLAWLGGRVGVSYVGMFFPSWQVDGNYDLLGVPSSVSGKGFMVQAGLFLGTF